MAVRGTDPGPATSHPRTLLARGVTWAVRGRFVEIDVLGSRAVLHDRLVWLLTAGLLLGGAAQLRRGSLDGVALGMVVAATVLVVVVVGRGARSSATGEGRVVLARTALVVQLVALAPLAFDAFDEASAAMVALAAVGGLVVALTAWDQLGERPVLGRWGALAMVAGVGLVGWCWLRSQPLAIDVLTFQRVAVERLLAGHGPWAPGYPNIYGPGATEVFYGPGLADGEVLNFGFPYPPLSLLLAVPGALAGDVRLAHLAAVVVAGGLLLGVEGRRWSGRAGGVLLLTTPMLLPIVARGFTESFLNLALVGATVGVRRARRPLVAVVALGLFVAVKQYAVLLLPLLVLAPRWPSVRQRVGVAAGAVGVAIVVTAPFALFGLRDLVHSTVVFHLRQPFRTDAMSVTAFVARNLGVDMAPVALPATVLALAAALWWTLRRAGDLAGRAAGCTLVMLAFLLFDKQAFTNYYVFVTATAWLAVAFLPARGSSPPGSATARAVVPRRPELVTLPG